MERNRAYVGCNGRGITTFTAHHDRGKNHQLKVWIPRYRGPCLCTKQSVDGSCRSGLLWASLTQFITESLVHFSQNHLPFVTMSLATANTAAFFVKARIEGKYGKLASAYCFPFSKSQSVFDSQLFPLPFHALHIGRKCVRIPFNQSTDTKESIVNTILDLYLPPDDKPTSADDYAFELLDIRDKSWSIEISSNVDLHLAMSDFSTKSTRCLPMLVKVRKKTDPEPLIATFDDVGGLAPQLNSNAFYPPADSPSSNQNPNATRIVSPARKPAAPKRRKIGAGASGGSAGRGGRGGRGNSGQSVRARIIGSIAELRALGKPNPPRIEVAWIFECC